MNLKNKFWINKKVLITGHTGFKGSWLSMYLNTLGAKVIGFSLPPRKDQKLFNILNIKNKIFKNYFYDILDIKKLKEVIKKNKPKIVFHLAAQSLVLNSYKNPQENFMTNLVGTVNLMEILRKDKNVKSTIFITTDKCYKIYNLKRKYKESAELGGVDPYSASKACAEIIVNSYNKSFFSKRDNTIATARSGNIIGGGDFSQNRIIPDIVRSIINKNKLIIRNKKHTRPWLFILDTLTGYLKLAEHGFSNKKVSGAWNFGPKKSYSVNQILQYCLKEKIINNFKENKSFINKETPRLMLDSTKSYSVIKWRPKLNLSKSLYYTFEWYKNYILNKDMKIFTTQQIQKFLKNEL